MTYFIWHEEKQSGPYTREEVVQWLVEHPNSADTHFWREGWGDWKKLEEVEELRGTNLTLGTPKVVFKPIGVSETEKQIFHFIATQEFLAAAQLAKKYQKRADDISENEIIYDSHSPVNQAKRLHILFERTPGILKGIDVARLYPLRAAAGMNILLGKARAASWLPDNFSTGIRLDAETAVRMLESHVSHVTIMAECRENGAKTVIISSIIDGWTCPHCKKLDGKVYPLAKVPELPYTKCTNRTDGCRCLALEQESDDD